MPGYWSADAYFPEDDVAVVVLSNSQPDVWRLLRATTGIVLGGPSGASPR